MAGSEVRRLRIPQDACVPGDFSNQQKSNVVEFLFFVELWIPIPDSIEQIYVSRRGEKLTHFCAKTPSHQFKNFKLSSTLQQS